MPLVTFLRENAMKAPGWHRVAERRARGLPPVTTTGQLAPWERQLVCSTIVILYSLLIHRSLLTQALVEILLLSGGTPHANFDDLAHAWGREKGFHRLLASNVCERRGEVERKRRVSDPDISINKRIREDVE